ncbi:putative clathrin adaptor, mu subunit [Lupinus albus]|uniref:Putative clathrin adaptor, mu subunit n=1 Tax=Lupinus albus TaxID=3870 RepID=A0A6A4Q1L1_LUPAL|nr:putative clathrin adaptor, mu subunit [Lupinus albus]
MPVSASAIYFLNLRGDVLINRLYRDDVGGNMVDAFRTHIMQTKELGVCPVRQIGGCSFFYMKISNVYIVIVVSSNANVACAFKFVVEEGPSNFSKLMQIMMCWLLRLEWLEAHCAVALFKSYFGGAFDEDAIRNNFVLIYELLDEIMDFGYPQNLSPEILKLYITQEGVRSPFSSKAADKAVPNATLQVTGAVGWRREGLVYKKNEVFLDIVESVNLLMSSKGSVLRCDVTGKVLMKCFLSGMPDLKLGLNDKIGLEKESQLKSRPTKSGKTIELDDVTFHQCVNLTRFNAEKTVSFVPPDGEFELMKYRITEGVNLPFKVLPTIKELGRTRMEVNVKVKSVFSAKMFALGVVVKIPVPKQTAKTNFTVTSGKAKYNASIDCLVWKIRKFPGQTESTLSAEVELISTMTEKKSATKPPIQMEFQVPMFTASGLRVRFLKVWEKSGYNTVEWVRYITKAGSYEIRC